MRTNILARRFSAFSKATSLLAMLSFATACSNDAMRWDAMTTASITGSSNQSNIIGGQENRLSDYGEEFGTQKQPIRVVQRNSHHRPQSSYSQPGRYASLEVRPPQTPTIASSELPSVAGPSVAHRQPKHSEPLVLQPRRTQSRPLRVQHSDQITTGSVPVPTTLDTQSNKSGGWNNKGTRVTVRSGETLHNLSRRYGVPVSAIMRANQMSDADHVQAGSKILIPTYNYSSEAPISAPDSDPITNASRASRGFQGQPRGRVAVPTARVSQEQLPVTTPVVNPQQSAEVGPKRYVVSRGDTLSGIAVKTGASVKAIRRANSMTDDTVRLGQMLIIPGVTSRVDRTRTGSVASNSSTKTRVKPTQLASTESVGSVSPESKPTQRPAAQGSISFRWPAHGQVISRFGQRSDTGTNDGIDISMPVGTPVKASQSGTVIYAGSELEDFGNLILVSHSGGWVSAYAHSSANLVRRGDKVSRGQTIAKSGRSGNARVPKLHFELRKNSNPVDPLNHLK